MRLVIRFTHQVEKNSIMHCSPKSVIMVMAPALIVAVKHF